MDVAFVGGLEIVAHARPDVAKGPWSTPRPLSGAGKAMAVSTPIVSLALTLSPACLWARGKCRRILSVVENQFPTTAVDFSKGERVIVVAVAVEWVALTRAPNGVKTVLKAQRGSRFQVSQSVSECRSWQRKGRRTSSNADSQKDHNLQEASTAEGQSPEKETRENGREGKKEKGTGGRLGDLCELKYIADVPCLPAHLPFTLHLPYLSTLPNRTFLSTVCHRSRRSLPFPYFPSQRQRRQRQHHTSNVT
ncbi:hypothetical protein LY76DRAFT_166006 [Colletotrichum caudatum]|nr:hypothetical protein LY76DRAFT_304326 [Colletotrichum caudatum]KAK2056059.1 hypothetical protein LY76DRAFT_166006 [Colletotrichum caudatum]